MLPLLALVLGCHHHLPADAPAAAHLQVFVITGPTVSIASPPADQGGIFGSAEGVANELAEIDQAARIQQAVDVLAVQSALAHGVDDTTPLPIQTDALASLQVQVVGYGLEVPEGDQPGRFTFSTRVRVYDADGKRIFHARQACSQVPQRPIDQLSDAQIASAFVEMARTCGQQVGERLGR